MANNPISFIDPDGMESIGFDPAKAAGGPQGDYVLNTLMPREKHGSMWNTIYNLLKAGHDNIEEDIV